MLGGPNLTQLDQICATVPRCRIIASGGMSAPEHIRALQALGRDNLYGAIVGKALYDGKTTLAELLAAAS
jgi:phosphoribosylformimino-5-aminoimidazole carboxamide ribotide isomerase